MSQISGAFTVEVHLERLAERVAERVVAMLQAEQARTSPSPTPPAPATELAKTVSS
jgi:hypothetical protein